VAENHRNGIWATQTEDIPERNEKMKIFDLESPLMQFLGKVADLMIINCITLICCIPIFTIGPALTAAHYVCLKMVRKEDGYIVKNYFKSFKQNFKQATLIWMLLLAVILILAGDYYIIAKSGLEFHKIFKILLIIVGVVIAMVAMFIFPVLAKFDNTIRATIKNAFLMSLLQLPKVFLMVILYAIPLVVFIFWVQATPVVIMFGISLPIFLSAALYNKFFQRIEDGILEQQGGSEEAEEEDDPDRIFSDKLDESLIGQDADNFRP